MAINSIVNYQELWDRIKDYAYNVGRVAVRPVLLLYFVLPIIGWLDEITSLAVAIQRMSKYITPEMEAKVDGILDQWFPVYAEFEEVTV